MSIIFRALRFFRPEAGRIAGVSLLLLAGTAVNLLKPWPLAIILDSVLSGKPLTGWLARFNDWSVSALLLGLGLAILALHALHAVLSATQTYGLIAIGLRGLARVREHVFHWLQRLSLRYHQGSSQGDIIYRASWDTYAFQTLFQHGVFAFLSGALSLAMMVAVMAQLNLALTAAALGTAPLLMLAMRFFGVRMGRKSAAAHQADSGVTALVQQGMAALPLVQSYGRESTEEGRFQKQVRQALTARLSQHGWEVSYLAVIGLLFGLGLAAIAWLGAQQVLAGRLTVGELWVFLSYLGQFYEPLNQLSRVGATVADASAGTRRVFEILDTPEEIQESPQARPVVREAEQIPPDSRAPAPLRVKGSLEFQNVSFGYVPGRLVLQSLSFSLPAGQRVAIIGPSGAGKSTLIHLLPRFFDPSQGRILLDGVDLRELRLKDLRRQIALVMQEPILLPATVAENIAFARPEATLLEIERAAQNANAHAFIQSLPKGYNTVVGEGAARLSTGEKQRLNLARAFLKDAPILVLDEPTSALDMESEAAVVDGLQRLASGRTTLVVAHRLSTIRQSDHILVLENGRMTAQGPPHHLLHQSGYYQRVMKGTVNGK